MPIDQTTKVVHKAIDTLKVYQQFVNPKLCRLEALLILEV